MSLEVRRKGQGWAVLSAEGAVVAGPYSSPANANRRRAELMQGQSEFAKPGRATTTRPCLCCQEPFASEGAHNRLCGSCRRRDGTMVVADAGRQVMATRRRS